MTSKTHILLDEEYDVPKQHTKRRWPWHNFAKVLLLSAIVLLFLLLLVVYYGEFFQTEEVLHGTMLVSSAETAILSESNIENSPSNDRIKELILEELRPADLLQKWSKYHRLRHHGMRFKRDLVIEDEMIDPMQSDFNELRAKIRDKRTKSELSKLEKDYAKCKQESVSRSDCMETFIKMYKIAKAISEKMEKMKQIFRDSEIVNTNSMSSSMEKYLNIQKIPNNKDKAKQSKPKGSKDVTPSSRPKQQQEVMEEEGHEADGYGVSAKPNTTEATSHGLKKLFLNDDELGPYANEFEKIPDAKTDQMEETTKSGLKKIILDNSELGPSADVWAEADKIPHFDKKETPKPIETLHPAVPDATVDYSKKTQPGDLYFDTTPSIADSSPSTIPITTEIFVQNLTTEAVPFLTVKIDDLTSPTAKTDEPNGFLDESAEPVDSFKIDPLDLLPIREINTTTEGFGDSGFEPITKGFEDLEIEFVTAKATTTLQFEEVPEIQTNASLQQETDTVPVLDLDFGILKENSSTTTESFHTDPDGFTRFQTTEGFHTVSEDLFKQDEVTESMKSTEPEETTDALETIELTTESFFETASPLTTESFLVTHDPMQTEVVTTALNDTSKEIFIITTEGPFFVSPNLNVFTSKTDEFSPSEAFTVLNEFSSKIQSSTTDGLLTTSFTVGPSDNFDSEPIIPEERSNRNLNPGIKTVLSNYTTDVKFSYSGKCLSSTTAPSTTPGQASSTECSTEDPVTEGPKEEKHTQGRPAASEDESKSNSKTDEDEEHSLDNPSSHENMVDDITFETKNHQQLTTTHNPSQDMWMKKFKEGSQDASKNITEVTNTHAELIDTFGELDHKHFHKFGPKMNPIKNAAEDNNKQLMTLCEYLAKQSRSKVTSSPEQNDDITPSPNIQFTSRGPGFPVTGETMKASAQFFINPNYGVPSIPVCFYITPASFRMMMQPFWSPFFGMQGLHGGGNAGVSGNSGGGGVFIVPPSFGNMQNSGNFFGQTGSTGSGSQGNIPNIFSKSASSQQQNQKQQQFFCTYMQNGRKHSGSGGNRGYSNMNFKMRNSSGNDSSPSDIIYSSYWNKLPGYYGSNLGQEDRFQCPLDGDVPCYGGKECVPEKKWCDSIVDCSDGSDEAACTCRKRILEDRICDGYQDCPLGEDEIGCFGCDSFRYSCYDNVEEFERANRSTLAMCYSSKERCDGVRNCINGRDESGCNLIVADLTHHMSHAVSGSSGYLYHNYHGEWYPVCNNAHQWAQEACSEELGDLINEPSITFQEVELPGPFIEPHHSGGAHFPLSCQKRDRDMLSDIVAHVTCPQAKCGVIQEFVSPLMRSRRRRRSRETMTDASRIVGGTYSKPLQWPFVVAVYRNGDFHCGGTIISEQWIITAAHCTINFQKYFYEVRAGMLRRSSFSSSIQIHHVSHVVVHQMYERRTMKNDLALMQIDTPLRFNRWVKPICLPSQGRTTMGSDWIWGPEANTICTVVGWGAVREKGPGSDRLKEVQLPIRRRCTEKDDQEAEDICAGEVVGGRDACQGDSGGPLFCRSVSNNNEWYLAGVVSHGNGCARAREFGVYTRVALYLDWIAMAMRPELLPKVQPKQLCPGYVCIWGGKRCIRQSKRCDRLVDCLGGEDEVGCIYNYIPDVGAGRNASTSLVMDEADQEGATTTEDGDEDGDAEIDGKNFESGTDTEPSSLEIPTDNMATASIDDTTNSPSTFLVETISENVVTGIVVDTTIPSLTTLTPTEPISEPNPSFFSSTTMPTSEADQAKLKDLAVKFLDTIEMQSTSTVTDNLQDGTTNTSPGPDPDITPSSVTSTIPGFGDFKADLGEIVSESPTTVHKRENATEKDTSTTVKLKTMPKKIAEKFVCQKIPQIIDERNRCDRIPDCEDGTDEEGCTCRQYLKGPLNILICDGKIDCEDFTDEDDCGNCTSTQFLCPMSKTCIKSTSRCDDIVDCQYKEDEKDCFALTNGREIHLNSHKQPKLQSAGIFARNVNGQWRVVCSHDTKYHEHVAKTAEEVCSLLGFKGSKFHNTTDIIDDTIVPIDPDLVQMGFPKDRHAIGDSGHLVKHFARHFVVASPSSSPRSERLEKSIGNCQGLFIECVPKSNGTQPLKTITAGNEISPKTLDIQGFKPNSKKTISDLFSDKKDEILDKLNKIIETKKTVLVHDKLHEGVEKIHWPWLVSVYANGELWCIGVLVDKHWVLVHESCYYGVSLDTVYVTVLLGGGKSKQTLHKSPHEQIKRVDCFDTVENSDVMLLHLDNAAHFTRHVLPTFLPDMTLTEKDKGKTSNKCMSVVHDKFGGIKVTPTMEKSEVATCGKDNELSCYQWDPKAIIDFKKKNFGKDNEMEEIITSAADQDEEVRSLLDFCKDLEDSISYPYNQGVIVCREENTGWYPMAYYTYNATECNNSKQPFRVRTLDKVYSFIQDIIDQPKCKNSDPWPRPHCPTMRCPLGNCLLPEQMCNGKVDCHDGSDEEKEYCRLHRNECKASELKCRSNGKCIPKTKFCDNISDCEDLTDEPRICSCFTYLQATDPSKICDGIRNCWDKSDESSVLCNCTSDRFPCGSSRSECIPRDFVCDNEPDCPNGEDERYCYGIEQPIKSYSSKRRPPYTSGYGQVTEQSYGVWHTKCFPRDRPPNNDEVSEICRKLGYYNRRPPSYRLIDDNAEIVAATDVQGDGFKKSAGKYREATKAVVINKFSPLHLNEDLTLIMKPSRPIAQLVKWNQTDSSNCYRLEVKCN